MQSYQMLQPDAKIMIAVSGGIDSLVLAWILDRWRHKTPFSYSLLAVHIDLGFDTTTSQLVADQLNRLSIPYIIDHFQPPIPVSEIDGCYHCARQRRNRLFDLAAQFKCRSIAFGHHKEDMLETLFLNLCYAGNISTLLPQQHLFNKRLSIIRPMAYLEKADIIALGKKMGITAVKNPCRFSEDSKRQKMRDWLTDLYARDPVIKGNMFAALGNVKLDYLPGIR